MNPKDIKQILAQTGLPLTYYQWPEKEAPALPYIVWYLPGTDNFAADDKVYQQIHTLNVELYTDNKDFELEQTVEAVLEANDLVWDKVEAYIDTERMYQVLYTMEVYING